MAEVLGSSVYTVDDEPPAPSFNEEISEKNLSHSASSDTLKEVRFNLSGVCYSECILFNSQH